MVNLPINSSQSIPILKGLWDECLEVLFFPHLMSYPIMMAGYMGSSLGAPAYVLLWPLGLCELLLPARILTTSGFNRGLCDSLRA